MNDKQIERSTMSATKFLGKFNEYSIHVRTHGHLKKVKFSWLFSPVKNTCVEFQVTVQVLTFLLLN